MDFDPSSVPESARALLALAERWGIGDDYDREAAVGSASHLELQQLVDAVDGAPDDFWDWLSGPLSDAATPSREYVALTNLTMAADSARLRVDRV
jgi:hypothetical protein